MNYIRFIAIGLAAAFTPLAEAGMEKLSPAQRSSLEQQIEKEIALARSGNVTSFSTSFTARRTLDQKASAGLDQLSVSELADIDAHIERTLAVSPQYYHTRTKITPVSIETEAAKAKISHQVSMTYGTDGHGNNFYGGEVATAWESPSRKTVIAVTLSRYKGDGVLLARPFCDGLFSDSASIGVIQTIGR
jgi:hypothetical protein